MKDNFIKIIIQMKKIIKNIIKRNVKTKKEDKNVKLLIYYKTKNVQPNHKE